MLFYRIFYKYFLKININLIKIKKLDLIIRSSLYFYSLLIFNILILFLFNKYLYAKKETMLSNALPIPNIKAMLIKEGVHNLLIYNIKHIP